jgi:hypothetical protein
MEHLDSLPPARTPVSQLFEADDEFETKDFESEKKQK